VKKKILSIALTVALLITLIPLSTLEVRAESGFTASQEIVDMIKQWEGFNAKPYWDYQQWTVGYGTRVPDGKLKEYQTNGIPEEEAEALLFEFLEDMGKSLNSFLDKFALELTQSQFDALLSLTFNCGPGWLYKASTLRTAVIQQHTGNDFLFAFAQWSNSGDKTLPSLVRRRLAEANLYLNGVYDVSVPEDYSYVLYDANGGETDVRVQAYIAGTDPEIRAVGTYEGSTFAGWYTDPTGGERVEKLDDSVNGYTLYAHWTAGADSDAGDSGSDEITGTPVSYEKQVATGTLNVFKSPVKGAWVVDAYPLGTVLKIVAEFEDEEGIKWGQLSGGGWVNLSFTKDYEETEPEEDIRVEVTVTATDVNIRRGPSTSYAVISRADRGDKLTITATANGAGYLWGKSQRGWIVLTYTDYASVVEGDKPQDPTEPEPTQPEATEPTEPEVTKPTEPEATKPTEPEPTQPEQETPVATGSVKIQSGHLNVRKGPGTSYGYAGQLENGAKVEIFEIRTAGGARWGRIEGGWICLTYVELDSQLSEGEGTEPTEPEETKPEETEPEETEPEETEPEETEPEETKPEETDPPMEDDPQQTGPVKGKINLSYGKMNIRRGPGKSYPVVGWVNAGDEVVIKEQRIVGGITWGRIDSGWISMHYVTVLGEVQQAVKGTVDSGGDNLRIRTGPGLSYSIAGYVAHGSRVEILERQTVSGMTWGRVEKGWISLDYVILDTPIEEQPEQKPEDGTFTGYITANRLNVRKGPGTGYSIVGWAYGGELVTVLETKEVSGKTWGKIDKGWICLDYLERK